MKKVLAVTGPTASGKSKLAVEIASKINGQIISADSRQIYKNISIATCHPSSGDLKKVKHYFINELNLEEDFNAGEFGKKGRQIIDAIFSNQQIPVIAGGSGLYLRSLIDGFFEEEIMNKSIRKELYEKLHHNGTDYLYEELKKVDKVSADSMQPENIRRVIRALEVFYASGKKISDLQKNNAEVKFETVQFGLLLDRKFLYKRINERTDEMIEQGLLNEVRNLISNGYHYKKNNSLNTVGIKEVFKYFENELSYDEMISLIKQNTRRYAKRQMTWFRKDNRINWIEVNENSDLENLSNEIINIFRKS